MLLVDDPRAEIKSFVLSLSSTAGTKRGQGRGSFVGSVTSQVNRFYGEVVQYLKEWSPRPPRPQDLPSKSDDQSSDASSILETPPKKSPVIGSEWIVQSMRGEESPTVLPAGINEVDR